MVNHRSNPATFSPVTIQGLADVGAWLIGIGTVTGFFGAWWWFLDLSSHFRIHYFWGGIALAAYYGIKRQKTQTGIAAGIAVVNLVVLQPHLIDAGTDRSRSAIPHIRAVWWNVHSSNDNRETALEWITQISPDIIALGEVNLQWEESLTSITNRYPYQHVVAREDNFGIAIYSRIPLFNPTILQHDGPTSVPSLKVEIQSEGKLITLIATHPLPPIGGRATKARNAQLRWLSNNIRGRNQSTVILGDLNATPWNHALGSLLHQSGLRNEPKGLFPTWPGRLSPFGIPIDHCLTSRDLVVTHKDIGPALGSDHAPMVVTLGW